MEDGKIVNSGSCLKGRDANNTKWQWLYLSKPSCQTRKGSRKWISNGDAVFGTNSSADGRWKYAAQPRLLCIARRHPATTTIPQVDLTLDNTYLIQHFESINNNGAGLVTRWHALLLPLLCGVSPHPLIPHSSCWRKRPATTE
jgi:hypothetical protein